MQSDIEKIRIGISACLLGEKVRYDGGHKLDRFLVQTLGTFVEYLPVCPEVEAGFPVPREAFRLVGDPQSPRLITQKTKLDVTERMKSWAEKRLDDLEKDNLCGFIFKANSPSSGMERVRVYNESNVAEKKGAGIFARALMGRFPLLPVEEEGRLSDLQLRENFIERIFTFWRWQQMVAMGENAGNLVRFHSRHKLLLMAHHPKMMRDLGALVADAKKMGAALLFPAYLSKLMSAMAAKATVKKHTNVLQHMMGYFKKQLTGEEKKELLEEIGHYHDGLVPLIVPMTLISHYARKYRQSYLLEQYYLNPLPLELKLRNHA